jgi:hypothetical protein
VRRLFLIALVVLAAIAVGVGVESRLTTARSPASYQFNLREVNYPVDCGEPASGTPQIVEASTLAGPVAGKSLVVVVVACDWMDGSAPGSVLVYENSGGHSAPRLVQTLLSFKDSWTLSAESPQGKIVRNPLRAIGPHVSILVSGYKGNEARCCPGVFAELTWIWSGGSYRETSKEPPHNRLAGSTD